MQEREDEAGELVHLEFVGSDALDKLPEQQQLLFAEIWMELVAFLRTRGCNPQRNEGYAESNIRPVARRILQAYQYQWHSGKLVLHLTTDHADGFVAALNNNNVTTNGGKPYSEGSKRKFVNALSAYFRFKETDWTPPVNFGSNDTSLSSDPLTREERETLLTAACEYNSPPSYRNVSPEERGRWNAELAQRLGVPKEQIGPKDWQRLQRNWKIPALISVALDIGARAALIGRLHTGLVYLPQGQVKIPGDVAVKNNQDWENELSERTVRLLRKWLEQRQNMVKYDESDLLWLNRQGNPYQSSSLNTLLQNLLGEAGIDQSGRKLTWHSVRHSTGMYIYAETEDLGYVAEVLRQRSLQSARQYAHPTPESKTDLIESIQGAPL